MNTFIDNDAKVIPSISLGAITIPRIVNNNRIGVTIMFRVHAQLFLVNVPNATVIQAVPRIINTPPTNVATKTNSVIDS